MTYSILKTLTILYVEDESSLQQQVTENLTPFVKKIITAENGLEGIQLFEAQEKNGENFDLVITDITMPNTDGIALSEYIRDYNKNLPIVIMSAYTNTDYLLSSIDLNILTYITKPFTTKKVFILLDKILEFFNLNNQFILKDNIIFNAEIGTITTEGENIILTSREIIFIKLLIENSIVSYNMMYEHLWDYDTEVSSNALKSFIKKIKKKLPLDMLKNKQGIGYYLDFQGI